MHRLAASTYRGAVADLQENPRIRPYGPKASLDCEASDRLSLLRAERPAPALVSIIVAVDFVFNLAAG